MLGLGDDGSAFNCIGGEIAGGIRRELGLRVRFRKYLGANSSDSFNRSGERGYRSY